MKNKMLYILIGALLCFSCVTMMSSKILNHNAGGAPSLATSADGKHVYIMGRDTDNFYRSEDFGKTFENIDIDPEVE